ncbi:hypothetical protein E3C22_04205 [Jiella endophytica]|uniref:MFS transporter n=1 Tax=Jiella endophytica TaxID=2558362 RepID=A0A4Y8RTN1_9HYPH|nr:hypothetical protein [Jiella endophytica]TFF27665.1 hypothetical protein E3C22_04205 [Jiella endophytica]
MTIDPGLLGGLVGLAIGVLDFFLIGYVMEQMRKERPSERLGAMAALNVARISQLILFPVMGWFVGQTIAS